MRKYSSTNEFQKNLVVFKILSEDLIKVTYLKMATKKPGFERRRDIKDIELENILKDMDSEDMSKENFDSITKKTFRDKNDHKLKNNLSRARTKIFELSMSNNFDYFITLTLDSEKADRGDIEEFIKRLNKIVRNMRRRLDCNIQYLLIPEKHQDGAWHMHGLIKGIPKNEIVKNKNGYLEWKRYVKNFGYMSMSEVKNNIAVSKYITKYVNKTLANGIEKNSKSYYSTRGLRQPKIIKKAVMTKILRSQLPKNAYENKYFAEYFISIKQYSEIEYLLNDIVT